MSKKSSRTTDQPTNVVAKSPTLFICDDASIFAKNTPKAVRERIPEYVGDTKAGLHVYVCENCSNTHFVLEVDDLCVMISLAEDDAIMIGQALCSPSPQGSTWTAVKKN